jgi:hypothetical protein
MKTRLMPPFQAKIFLMDWKGVVSHWAKDWQCTEPTTHLLNDALSEYWFKRDKRGEQRFEVGLVQCGGKESPLMFLNGIHRTRVLAKFLSAVPLAAQADVYRQKLLSGCIIREIPKDEYLDLPDLPIHMGGKW